jgi:hypothetical protein
MDKWLEDWVDSGLHRAEKEEAIRPILLEQGLLYIKLKMLEVQKHIIISQPMKPKFIKGGIVAKPNFK